VAELQLKLCALACIGVKAAARMVKISGSCGSGFLFSVLVSTSMARPVRRLLDWALARMSSGFVGSEMRGLAGSGPTRLRAHFA
jgi:hypothetical protein